MFVGAGELTGTVQQLPVALADPDPLERHQRLLDQLAELGQNGGDLIARPDRDDHHRNLGVATEQARTLAAAVPGPVDAQQDGGARQAAPVQQLTDGDEHRRASGALLTADVQRQLGGFGELVWEVDPLDLTGNQPRPLECEQARMLHRLDLREQRLDLRSRVDGDRDNREILRQRQQHVRMQHVLGAEPRDPAQQDAALDLPLLVEVEQAVSKEPTVASVAFAEVGRELQAVVVHRVQHSPIISRPTATPLPDGWLLPDAVAEELPCRRRAGVGRLTGGGSPPPASPSAGLRSASG